MSSQLTQRGLLSSLPDPHHRPLIRDRDPLPIGRNGQRVYRLRRATENALKSPGSCLPDTNGGVFTASDELAAIGRKSQGSERLLMPAQNAQPAACRDFPEAR